jgi:hypothetical protein
MIHQSGTAPSLGTLAIMATRLNRIGKFLSFHQQHNMTHPCLDGDVLLVKFHVPAGFGIPNSSFCQIDFAHQADNATLCTSASGWSVQNCGICNRWPTFGSEESGRKSSLAALETQHPGSLLNIAPRHFHCNNIEVGVTQAKKITTHG